jgi:hypothetical protein
LVELTHKPDRLSRVSDGSGILFLSWLSAVETKAKKDTANSTAAICHGFHFGQLKWHGGNAQKTIEINTV